MMDRAFLEELGLEPETAERIWQEVEALRAAEAGERRKMAAEAALERAVLQQGGRSSRAVRALLDEEAVFAAEEPELAARQAVARVRREHGYLFQSPQAPGTGTARLADFTQEELGGMSMAEYKKVRRGFGK